MSKSPKHIQNFTEIIFTSVKFEIDVINFFKYNQAIPILIQHLKKAFKSIKL
jgi:hypothetical protein